MIRHDSPAAAIRDLLLCRVHLHSWDSISRHRIQSLDFVMALPPSGTLLPCENRYHAPRVGKGRERREPWRQTTLLIRNFIMAKTPITPPPSWPSSASSPPTLTPSSMPATGKIATIHRPNGAPLRPGESGARHHSNRLKKAKPMIPCQASDNQIQKPNLQRSMTLLP